MASIAVLPILIGLAVDYAIQLQARYDEAIAAGLQGAEAARQAATRGGPTIGIACLATAAGFLALQLSPTPMVRSFGWLLIVGIAIAFALALTAGFAALSLRREHGESDEATRAGGVGGRGRERSQPHRPQAPPPATGPARRSASSLWPSPTPAECLAVGLALAVLGWGLGTQIEHRRPTSAPWSPRTSARSRDLNELQDVTGVSGELDVSVEAPDLADPALMRWMAEFKQRVLSENGFAGPHPSCRDAEVCPGPALSDFVAGGAGDQAAGAGCAATAARLRPSARSPPMTRGPARSATPP